MNASFDLMLLRNLAAGAPLSPQFYCLDVNSRAWKGVAAPRSNARISGYGSTLITFSEGRWSKRLLAVYLRNCAWMIYDGEQEMPLAEVGAVLSLGNCGRSTLTLRLSSAKKTIDYLRPWLRLWFESGWALDDIDTAHLICQCINDKEVLPRLERALEVANSELGFKANGSA